jgi:uncharacterized protein (DUF2062 family)
MCTVTGFNIFCTHWRESLYRQIASPVMKRLQVVLSCGLSPQKLALTLCIGSALGILPLLWGTSLICILVAHLFKLNHIALQSVNYLLYPLQLALLVPFLKLGTWLFPWGAPLPAHILSTLIHNPGMFSLKIFAGITLKSVAAWLVTAVPAVLLIYGILMLITKTNTTQTTGQ